MRNFLRLSEWEGAKHRLEYLDESYYEKSQVESLKSFTGWMISFSKNYVENQKALEM